MSQPFTQVYCPDCGGAIEPRLKDETKGMLDYDNFQGWKFLDHVCLSPLEQLVASEKKKINTPIEKIDWIINPHWDKCLRKHNVSDEVLGVIAQLLHDTSHGYDRAMRDNGRLMYHTKRISDEMREISFTGYVHNIAKEEKSIDGITDDIVYELNILGGQLGGSQRDLIFEVVKKHIQ